MRESKTSKQKPLAIDAAKRRRFAAWLLVGLQTMTGCGIIGQNRGRFHCPDVCIDVGVNEPSDPCQQLYLTRPTINHGCTEPGEDIPSPYDLDEASLTSDRVQKLTLQECISEALATSNILRDLGGTVVRSPQSTVTRWDPGLIFTDPRNGEVAALSAFDANFFVNSFYERNDRALNNQFFGNQGLFKQDQNVAQVGVNKRSATGGLFGIRNVTTYDSNNQLSNRLGPRSWENYIENEIRQPLLQGAGSEFNRIAGPGATPGQLNGVLLARVRTDVGLTEFERAVRDLVAEVENSYWDLYYAYRDLEAKIQVRDIAAVTLDSVRERGESAGNRAQAEEQLHRFQSDIIDALHGRPIDGTRTNNGSAGGTFRGSGGIRISERKLRLLIGRPINDGSLIQPSDTPTVAPITFDWQSSLGEALQEREELRRQRWVIKQRELELLANRNFLRPQLDVVSRYRFRGFGEDLFGSGGTAAMNNLFDGNLQEWQVGVEYNLPVGLRRGHAAVRNSQLALARECHILQEQERFVQFGLSNSVNECKRAYESMLLQAKRLEAIVNQLNAIDAKERGGDKAELDVRLETHRRLLDARLRYHQSQVEYALALRNVHFEKGTLLRYCSVFLTEQNS
jgi:outer membrane protein TolC